MQHYGTVFFVDQGIGIIDTNFCDRNVAYCSMTDTATTGVSPFPIPITMQVRHQSSIKYQVSSIQLQPDSFTRLQQCLCYGISIGDFAHGHFVRQVEILETGSANQDLNAFIG